MPATRAREITFNPSRQLTITALLCKRRLETQEGDNFYVESNFRLGRNVDDLRQTV